MCTVKRPGRSRLHRGRKMGGWKARLQALEKLPGSCLHRGRQKGSWKVRLQALVMLLPSCLHRVGEVGSLTEQLRAPGKLLASLQDTEMARGIGQLGRLPVILQRVNWVSRADPQERRRVTPERERRKMRRAGQRVKLQASLLKAMMARAMLKLQQAHRQALACSSTEPS